MPQLLALANTAATSVDIAVTDTSVRLTLFDASGDEMPLAAKIAIQVKCSNDSWTTFGYLTSAKPATSLNVAGTYRVKRPAGVTVGVDRS